MRVCVKCGRPAFDDFGDDWVCSDHMLEAVLAEIELERKTPLGRMRSGLQGLQAFLARWTARDKPLEEMSAEELENYLIKHAKEFGIIPVGRDERTGLMKFRFQNKETQ